MPPPEKSMMASFTKKIEWIFTFVIVATVNTTAKTLSLFWWLPLLPVYVKHKSPVKPWSFKFWLPGLCRLPRWWLLKCRAPGMKSSFSGWDLHGLSHLPGLPAPLSTRGKTLKSIYDSQWRTVIILSGGVYCPVLIFPTEINSNRGVKGIIGPFIPNWSRFGSA